MSNVEVIGDKLIKAKIAAFTMRVKNAKKPLQESGEYVVKNVLKNFQSEGYFGQNWKPLSPFTASQRARLGFGAYHPILERTGKLKKGFKILQLNNFSVKIGNQVSYYRKHQLGEGVDQRKMLGVTNPMIKDIKAILRKYLVTDFI